MKFAAFAFACILSVNGFSPQTSRGRHVAFPRVMRASTTMKASPMPAIEKLENSSVRLRLEISEEDTLAAFQKAADEFGKVADIRGFRKGSKIPTQVVVNFIGSENIKSKAIQGLSEMLISQVSSSGLHLIGDPIYENGEDTVINDYVPGEKLKMDVVCDVWPEMNWTAHYDTVSCTVENIEEDKGRLNAALGSLQSKYKILNDAPEGHAAALGDVIIGNMNGFKVELDGSKGRELSEVASGDNLEILLQEGMFMPGMVEGLLGAKAGETKEVRVTFPQARSQNLPAELAGAPALFEVEVLDVKLRGLPELNDAFAGSIREGLTYAELLEEVKGAVSGENDKKNEETRNKVLEEELVKIADVEIPETLIMEQAREKYANMMSEFRAQGTPDEEIKKMITKEGFEKYKKIATPNIVKVLKSSLAVNDIANKEGIKVDKLDVEDQVALIKAQAEQKGEDFDDKTARDQIECQMQRDLVLNWLAERVEIEFVDVAPEPSVDELETAELSVDVN